MSSNLNTVIKPKIATEEEFEELKKLSTENLIIWIIGKAIENSLKLSVEDIVIECWAINPEKHSLRGYSQFPDSSVVTKRIGEMKGKKGLLSGSDMSGYSLTEISKIKYTDLIRLIDTKKVGSNKTNFQTDRNISSIDEAPYKRLIRTPTYQKFKENKLEQIIDTDLLFFYGINWHSKKSFIQNRIKNVDLVMDAFSEKDPLVKKLKTFLKEKFKNTLKQLTDESQN
jgi:hypothetical protein